jgi:serine/threonine-protein kinase
MELLHGTDLGVLQMREGVLSLPRSLRIALQVCSALGAAHGAGIIHRDLKPDNIFLIDRPERRDFVKLLDFGVAKLMNGTVDDASAFRSSVGMVVGTPNYMAPEQAMGQPANHLADVYSMGVILFEMVAGRRPFVGSTAREVMVQHMTVEPSRPSQLNPAHEIPEVLDELILACLRKDPAERPRSIQEVERRLRAILNALPAKSAGATAARPHARRRRKSLGLVTGAVLLLALAGGLGWAREVGLLSKAVSFAAELRAGTPDADVAAAPAADSPRTSRHEFTIETAPAAPAGSTVTTLAPSLAPPVPLPLTLPEGAAAPLRGAVQAPPAEKAAVRKPTNIKNAPSDVERPPATSERRHGKLDRGAVLNPFE